MLPPCPMQAKMAASGRLILCSNSWPDRQVLSAGCARCEGMLLKLQAAPTLAPRSCFYKLGLARTVRSEDANELSKAVKPAQAFTFKSGERNISPWEGHWAKASGATATDASQEGTQDCPGLQAVSCCTRR